MASSERATRGLARLLLRVFYREWELEGAEQVPAEGPVLFVANHGNALVDPMVLVATLPRVPRFLAKHTLWKNPAVRPLLELANAIPVYRAQDGATAKNDETFARCHQELADGGVVALFPEGISHDEPALQPLRTGAARIALGARAVGADPMTIVPVGLTFEEKDRFRSHLLVTVGEPIVPDANADLDDAESVRALTDAIDASLRGVTLNYETWERAHLAQRSAEIYAVDDGRVLPGRARLGRQFTLRRAFGDRYEKARAAHPERVEALEGVVNRYQETLQTLGLRDDHVTADYPWKHALGYVRDRLPRLFLSLPFAAIGFLLNYLPYRLPGWVASRVEEQRDQPATFKVITGMVVFPVFWAIESAIAWQMWGALGAAVTAVLAPITGWIALRFAERNESFWRELRAYLRLRALPERGADLRTRRTEIREELVALLDGPDGA